MAGQMMPPRRMTFPHPAKLGPGGEVEYAGYQQAHVCGQQVEADEQHVCAEGRQEEPEAGQRAIAAPQDRMHFFDSLHGSVQGKSSRRGGTCVYVIDFMYVLCCLQACSFHAITVSSFQSLPGRLDCQEVPTGDAS